MKKRFLKNKFHGGKIINETSNYKTKLLGITPYVHYPPKSQSSITHIDAYGKIFPSLQRDMDFSLGFDKINAIMFPSAMFPPSLPGCFYHYSTPNGVQNSKIQTSFCGQKSEKGILR